MLVHPRLQYLDEPRRDRNRSRTRLRFARLVEGDVRLGHVDSAPAGLRKLERLCAEHDHLGRPQAGVVGDGRITWYVPAGRLVARDGLDDPGHRRRDRADRRIARTA